MLSAAALIWYWLVPSAGPVPYKTSIVDRGPITAIVTATGTLNPVVTVQVGSQVSGKIKALMADYNSDVTEGQLVAQIDPAPFKAKVVQARAALKTAKSNRVKAETALAQRQLELNRATKLRADQYIPQADLDLARTSYRDAAAQVDVAIAQIEQAEAALASAELELSMTSIYSPVDGVVISRDVEVGQTVAAAFQTPRFFVIAQDLTKMQVNASVSEADIGGITEGSDAEFLVDTYPNEPFRGIVTQVRNAPITVQNVVTYDVIIRVDNPDLTLKPGMTANVSIVRAKRDDVLRVPNTALRFRMPNQTTDLKTTQVWVVSDSAMAQPVEIVPGVADAVYTEVSRGDLQEGDAVIIGLTDEAALDSKSLPPGFLPRMR
ncbi:RND transporter [Nitrospira sp.]|nr:RND transporter [Nitrospira sp.]